MWVVIKFERKNLFFLKSNLEKKFGKDCEFYIPKLLFQRHTKKNGKKKNLIYWVIIYFVLMKNSRI
tara:strand:- start:765 stop:962 length:198 start_codon:yes stop_codon:yes gene_type:complete